MKGSFLVRHDWHTFSKDKKGQSRSYVGKYVIGDIQLADTFGYTCDVITITSFDYVRGYVTTSRRITYASGVCVFVEHGSILANRRSNESDTLPANIDVYGNYVVFKNDVQIGAYISSGLDVVLRPSDVILVYYPINIPNLFVRSFEITEERYDRGYISLPVTNVTENFAYVYKATHLLKGIEYDIVGTNFVFRNNVTINSYTVTGLVERLEIGDIVTLIIQE